MGMIADGLIQITRVITAGVMPPIAEGTETIMKSIDEKIARIEKRILRKTVSMMILGFGATFLVLALFSLLVEYLLWSNAAAFFSIGITIFVIGLLLKAGDHDG